MDDHFTANLARDGSNYLTDSSASQNRHAQKSPSPKSKPNHESFSSSSNATANLEPPFCAIANMYSPALSSFQDDVTPGWTPDPQFSNNGSARATSGLDDGLFATNFEDLLSLENLNSLKELQDSSTVPQGPFISQAYSTAANGNLQPPLLRPIHHGHQLMSPCTTNHSSPRSSSEFVNLAGPQLSRVPPRSFPPYVQVDKARSRPAQQQQHTPARTDSPGQGSIEVFDDYLSSIISPAIHVESCSRANSPSGSEGNRAMGRKSHGPKKSGSFLSPRDAVASSEDEATSDEDSQNGIVGSHSQKRTHRDEDGSWMRDGTSGLAGIGPNERTNVNDNLVPSINEMEKLRIADEKKDEVQKWLTDTDKIGDSHYHGAADGPDAHASGHCEDITSNTRPESPAANIEIDDGKEEESYFPRVPRVDTSGSLPHRVQPWHDLPRPPTWGKKYQPDTSNAAMQRFLNRAREIDAASVTATISSFRTRRKSESEFASILSSSGISNEVTPANRPRKSSILNTFAKRTPSLLKKKSPPTAVPAHSLTLDTKASGIKRSGSWSRPKSPKVDNRPSIYSKGSGSHGDNLLSSIRGFREAISRSRSPSQTHPSLSELITGLGGPPMLSLPPDSPHDNDSDGSDEYDQAPNELDHSVVPTVDGFAQHAVEICRGRNKALTTFEIEEFIVKRAAELHHRSYKRLLDQKAQHFGRVRNGACSREFCADLGGQARALPVRAGKDGKTASGGFRILSPSDDEDDEDDEFNEDGTVQVSRPEKGLPLPPTKRLPAEFECPFCFEVKQFLKPSDWTQHVRDDVQPYFCTFRDCDCVRTWGRKADWKRHEQEKHRQLETFKCNWRNCGKEVARKANFLQHLIREHRVPNPNHEPKTKDFKDMVAQVRSGHRFQYLVNWKNGVEDFAGPGDETAKVWLIVHSCRQEKSTKADDEPCCFCGIRSTSWKSAFAHLARHMEVMSMPIPRLVQSKNVDADTITSPVKSTQVQRRRAKSAVSPHSGGISGYDMNLSFNETSTNLQSYLCSQLDSNMLGTLPSNTMTYPPPQIASPRSQPPQVTQQPQPPVYAVENGAGYANQSYPSPYVSSALRTPATNGGLGAQGRGQGQLHGGSTQAVRPRLVTSYASSGQVYQSPVEGPSFGMDVPVGLYTDNEAVAVDLLPFETDGSMPLPQEDFEQFAVSYTMQQQQQGFYL